MEIVLEIFILFAPLVPFLFLLQYRGLRYRLSRLPRAIPKIISLFIAYTACIVAMFLFAPFLLRISALFLCGVLLVLLWHALPNSGRARGLPRGSLTFFPSAPWHDQFFYTKQSARYGPIFKMREMAQPTICIIGLTRAQSFLAQHQSTLVTPPLAVNRFVPRGLLRYMNHTDHTEFRPIYQKALNAQIICQCLPFMQQTIANTLAHIAQTSATKPTRGVDLLPFFQEIGFIILARAFFGMTRDSVRYQTFCDAYRVIDFRYRRASEEQTSQTLAKLVELLDAEMNAARADKNAPRSFLAELARADRLHEPMYFLNLIYTLLISHNDWVGLSLWLFQLLGENPIWLTQLTAKLKTESTDEFAMRIVQETLRLEQSEFILRRTTRDIQFEGFTIPKNWNVRLCVWESHRDPNIFPQPNEFNPDRFLMRPYARSEYAPFGMFKKACLGEEFTMAFGKSLVTELARNYELHIVQSGKPEFSGFHWKPSSKLRVVLNPLAL